MQDKYLKFLLPALIIAFVVPQITLAAWWNPFSWGFWNSIFHRQSAPARIACPMIAKLCPDGSSVSPRGPKCEFPACPASTCVPEGRVYGANDINLHCCSGLVFQPTTSSGTVGECVKSTDQTANNVSCQENSKYFVILQSATNDNALNVLIKRKASASQKIPCAYNVEKKDFEIKDLLATFFLKLTDNFLILDYGTAPEPRGLAVYNLNNGEKVYNDGYSNPLTISGDTVTYWSPTNDKVTSNNCPQLNEYSTDGLGATIEAHITLNLSNSTKKNLGEYRCVPIQ